VTTDLLLSPERVQRDLDRIRDLVAAVPDFPKPGILFRDITPVLRDAETLVAALELHLHVVADLADEIDAVVGIESRGFLFGMGVAARLGAGFVPVRKPGKLPRRTTSRTYALEYGSDTLHVHAEDVRKGERVIVVDDLLATGGTANATCELMEELGVHVLANVFLIELGDLGGRDKLAPRRVESVLTY
jgi:adenine phosphoribosyltransferase